MTIRRAQERPGPPSPEPRRPAILVVEDEADIRELLRYNLEKERYRVLPAGSGEEALEITAREEVRLVLLDVMLPGIDGFEVCRRLRSDPRTARIPILLLTARSDEVDVVTGLELGAEDYVSKPFSTRVLLARVRTILRRPAPEPAGDGEILRRGELEIDAARHQVRLRGRPVPLTRTEFRLLSRLAARPGWVFRRDQLLDAVQGPDSFVLDRTVDVHIGALRRKLGDYGARVETVRGVGYRLSESG